MLNRERKNELVQSYKTHAQDTGSVQLQIALLTERINELNKHLKIHAHDNSSKYGLIKLVGQRRSFLRYLERRNKAGYKELITRLGIRG